MELHPSITPAFIEAINMAVAQDDTADLYDDYCERYKDAHGIKARWVYSNSYTATQWVSMFSMLAYDVDASIQRDDDERRAFAERIASVGLTEWAIRNNIFSESDLYEHNYWQSQRLIA